MERCCRATRQHPVASGRRWRARGSRRACGSPRPAARHRRRTRRREPEVAGVRHPALPDVAEFRKRERRAEVLAHVPAGESEVSGLRPASPMISTRNLIARGIKATEPGSTPSRPSSVWMSRPPSRARSAARRRRAEHPVGHGCVSGVEMDRHAAAMGGITVPAEGPQAGDEVGSCRRAPASAPIQPVRLHGNVRERRREQRPVIDALERRVHDGGADPVQPRSGGCSRGAR